MARSTDGGWIQLNDGTPFWPLEPKVSEIRLQDIVHSLSLQCRFNGHTDVFYSVAQHSVYVSLLAGYMHPKAALWGLFHDATEAYFCDLPRPIKDLFPQYAEKEDNLAKKVRKKFDIPYTDKIKKTVQRADLNLVFMERGKWMRRPHMDWPNEEDNLGFVLDEVFEDSEAWDPKEASANFLLRYEQIINNA